MSDAQVAVTAEAADAYVAFWQALSAETLDGMDAVMGPAFRFVDPFNDVQGLAAVRQQFAHTYRRLHTVRITVHDRAVSGPTLYLRWTFAFQLRAGGRNWSLEGMSEVRFGADGKALSHIDHWDAAGQVYEHLPVLGTLIRLIKRRV